MRTRRRKMSMRRHTRKRSGGKSKSKSGKKWTSAIEAAQSTLSKTGSLEKARTSLRKQALANARKLFGSVTA